MPTRSLPKLAIPVLALLASACVLQFDNGLFQTMALHFSLSRELAAGRETLVHSVHYPMKVTLKGRWVRVSGALLPPDGGALPDQVALRTRFEDAETGKLGFRMSAATGVDAGGVFSVRHKLRKNIEAGTLQTIFAEPRGADLPEGTRIWLCIDVVRSKKDLAALPDCGADGGSEPAPGTIVVQVLDNAFDPKRVRADPGDTVRWVLVGASLDHTVTAMEESVFDSGFLDTAGAFFEVTFTEANNNQTFEYSCRTHSDCCEMKGSVQVGANAPEPRDDY